MARLDAIRFALASLVLYVGCDRKTATPTAAPQEIAISGTPADKAAADPLANIDAQVKRVMDAYDVPGLAIAVVKDDAVVLAKGYGVRDRDEPGKVDGDTVFAIASNTKAFVATTVVMLALEGKLDLDGRVTDIIKRFAAWSPATTKELRVRDLMCHRSGLATWAGDAIWIGSKIDTAGILRKVPVLQADYGLRYRYGYSNIMFVVAGEVLRTITGEPWDAAVRQRLLEPLKMSRTSTSVKALAGQDNVATPHAKHGEKTVKVPYLDVDNAGAAGAMNSSVTDMAQWLRAQLAGGKLGDDLVIPPEVIVATRQPHTPMPRRSSPTGTMRSYALGWVLQDHRGRLAVSHGGGLPGMTSRVVMIPDEGIGVVVLTNSESAASGLVAFHVIDAYLGEAPHDYLADAQRRSKGSKAPPNTGKPPMSEADVVPKALRGSFYNPMLGKAEIDDELHLRLVDHGGLDCRLEKQAGTTFRCPWSNPIFGESAVTLEVKGKRVNAMRFRVRPEFVDPLEYVFTRRRSR